jgi:two-component system NarL family response regulator
MPRLAEEAIVEVLVVDDDEGFRRVLAAVLAADDHVAVVGEAADGNEGVTKAIALAPDVVVLDVAMPGTGGIDAARAIREWVPNTKVLMLTASDDEDDLYKALLAGANGYLLKDSALVDICVSVRTAAGGQAVLSAPMASKLVSEFAGPVSRAIPRLSTRELEILHLLAAGHSNPEIGEQLFLSPHTVKRHVANILAKLHQRTRLEAVLYAQRRNLLS